MRFVAPGPAGAEFAPVLPTVGGALALDDLAGSVGAALAQAGASGIAIEPVGDTRLVTGVAPDRGDVAVVVRVQPWTPPAVDALVARHYELGRTPAFAAVVAPTRPFAVDYLFGGAWWGALESDLYAELADPTLDPADPTPYVERARAVVARYVGDGEADLDALETLLAEIPRPTDEEVEYVPIATLVATGLLLGDEVRRRHPRLEWVPGAEVMARYFGLRDRGDAAFLLRPIDYAVQLFHTPVPGGIAAYAELVEVRSAD